MGGAITPGGISVGETIDGKYVLRRILGEGGMGIVFEAEHIRLKQRCAIKVLSQAMLEIPDVVHRFEREARASALLRGPHVVRVTDVETTGAGVPYIVMEYLEGRDLETELQARKALPVAEAVDHVLQACSAVAEAHAAGIVHRDLKPGNLYLAREGDGIILKVLDFGISKLADEEAGKLTGSGTMIGTALYMSPEQLRSAATVDGRSDIWALGVILYELIAGTTPWSGSAALLAVQIVSDDAPPIHERAHVPPALSAVIRKMLARDVGQRYARVADVAAALAPFTLPGGVGEAVAAQLARRAARGDGRGSDPTLPAFVGAAPTPPGIVAREVTNVGVTTSAGLPKAMSGKTIAAIALGIAIMAGIVGVILIAFVVRRPTVLPPPPVLAAGPASAPAPSSSASSAPLAIASAPSVVPAASSVEPHAIVIPRGSSVPRVVPSTAPSSKTKPRPADSNNPLFLN